MPYLLGSFLAVSYFRATSSLLADLFRVYLQLEELIAFRTLVKFVGP
jgi:hypothetical protein